MKKIAKIFIILLSIIDSSPLIKAQEPVTVADIRQIYNDSVKIQLDSIRAQYDVVSDTNKLNDEFNYFFESYYSDKDSVYCGSDSELIIILTRDEQVLLDFLNFSCGLDFGFRRCGYFFRPNLPELYRWYKNNFKYITDEQLKKYCELKSKMELYEINERFINWEFTNVIMRKYGWSLDVYNNINTFSNEESEKYLYELENLKESFLERQYNLEENKK